MPTGQTMPERTGWRDKNISLQHRLWGVEIQATDIDWLVTEYRNEYGDIRPVAIVEYKHEKAAHFNLSCSQYRVLGKLATRADLPFFIVRYASNFDTFLVTPANGWAKTKFVEPRQMSEIEYVDFMYHLRGYDGIPEKVRMKILEEQSKTSKWREQNLF